MNLVWITVTYRGGTYHTNAVNRVRVSCTAGHEQAATIFGERTFGPAFQRVEAIHHGAKIGTYQYAIVGDDMYQAYCWQTGLIQIAPGSEAMPEGALPVATGPERALRAALDAAARHGQGKSNGKLLVPGVPEAQSSVEQVDALTNWLDWRGKANGKPGSFGVVFASKKARGLAR